MEIKKLYNSTSFPTLRVVEKADGTFWAFNAVPYRTITENDLTPFSHFRPVGRHISGYTAHDFELNQYGLTEDDMGEKLKSARKSAGLSQVQLAEKMGVTQKDISRWENGTREPGVRTLKRLAQALECSMDDLV